METVEKQKPISKEIQIASIKNKLPAYLFEQNTLKGFMYVARDLTQVLVTVLIMSKLVIPFLDAWAPHTVSWDSLLKLPSSQALTVLPSLVLRVAAWNAFWLVQGLNFTGLWVMAHECGHQAFSPSKDINNLVGTIIHSALLVPYHPWRMSHGQHHHYTNHIDMDTVFLPNQRMAALKESVEAAPIVSLLQIVMFLTIGWPGYLLFNAAGHNYGRRNNHFEPSAPMFKKEDRPLVLQSDFVLVACLALLGMATFVHGWQTIFMWYGAPYFWCNMWLVYITYLQHSDVRVPHYSDKEWTYVRGALCTIDRDFGSAINWWLHHINDSHVVHHMFSTMPFYNAIQATPIVAKMMGEHYLTDDRGLVSMLWESWRNCRYVVPSEGVAYWHN